MLLYDYKILTHNINSIFMIIIIEVDLTILLIMVVSHFLKQIITFKNPSQGIIYHPKY